MRLPPTRGAFFTPHFRRPLRRTLGGLAALAVLAPLIAQRSAVDQGPTEFDFTVMQGVMVPMRDGVRLATDVYVPARDGAAVPGKFPVLVTRTPYGKAGGQNDGQYFARRGYAVVVQDVRGRYGSEGTFYIYKNEGPDGYDTIEWAAGQSWSNGSVGSFGGSYSASTQAAAALEKPSHLKVMFMSVGTSNYHEDGQAVGGASYLLHNVAYYFMLAGSSKEAQADPAKAAALKQAGQAKGLGEWLRAYPYKSPAPFLLSAADAVWFEDWVNHPDFDAYWKQKFYNFELYHDQFPDIPVYLASGWYDLFLRGTLHNFSGLAKATKTPKKLLVGAWAHGLGPAFTGDVSFGPGAAVNLRGEELRWFDEILKGKETGVRSEPPVKVFTMGGGDGKKVDGRLSDGGEWRTFASWPPADASPRPFYLQADGTMTERMPGPSTPSLFVFDPVYPVPTIGGNVDSGRELTGAGPRDQRCAETILGCRDSLPLSARQDVLVFQTPPLTADLEVTGNVSATLWVSSSAPDTDFTAKLLDVHPPSADYPWGYDMNLTDRIVRVRYSKSTERPELLKPGEVRKITIDLVGTSNRFLKGHRIRLDISSSNFPFFDVNPNTGEPVGRSRRTAIAQNTVYHDREHPSHLILPVMPAVGRMTER